MLKKANHCKTFPNITWTIFKNLKWLSTVNSRESVVTNYFQCHRKPAHEHSHIAFPVSPIHWNLTNCKKADGGLGESKT